MYLMVPKVRNGGYIPFFVTERRRSEAALIQVVQGRAWKMEKLEKAWVLKVFRAARSAG